MAEHYLKDHIKRGLEAAGCVHEEAADDSARYLSVVPRADGHEEAREEKTVQPGKDGGA